MRPRRLELEGFASFRERTVVDFEGVDLFVFTGPTGAGKSSLIDALTFALYGAVPRYDDRRLVAPAISQGRQEARVRLDFSLGEELYTAVRVVRKTASGGATTREARLLRGEEVLAANAEDLSARVEELIGLPFEHFTKCVVLPQGEFARFLRDKPKARQDLLVELLDLDLYRRMSQAANARSKSAAAQADWRRQRVEQELAGATPAALGAAKVRIAELDALRSEIEAATPLLDKLARQGSLAAEEAQAAHTRAALLEELEAPAEALELAARVERGGVEEGRARAALEKARKAVEVATARRGRLPEIAATRSALDLYEARGRLSEEVEKSKRDLVLANDEEKDRAAEVAEKRAALADAREEVRKIGQADLAAAVQGDLVVGDVCPVCGAEVESLPHRVGPVDFDRAQTEAERAKSELQASEVRLRQARDAAAAIDALVEDRGRRLLESDELLTKAEPAAELDSMLREIEQADAGKSRAEKTEHDAVAAYTDAGDHLAALEEKREEEWRRLQDARDPLTPLGPPQVPRSDLAGAWTALMSWAAAELPRHRLEAERHRERARELEQSRSTLEREIVDAGETAGLERGDESPHEACAAALAAARQVKERLEEEIDEVERLGEETKLHDVESKVAKSLAKHLGARRFEGWILGRAMQGLIGGASQLLLELSSGQYSLALDKKSSQFLVVDHANADETRLARTLSGGETFLASLSLALALSEHVSQLAARGAARLDAIFLDEGFGTLDADTLDTVAAAIEELGARGHMVGLVTHMRDLAERIPVRFEVSKQAGSSRVERVDLAL